MPDSAGVFPQLKLFDSNSCPVLIPGCCHVFFRRGGFVCCGSLCHGPLLFELFQRASCRHTHVPGRVLGLNVPELGEGMTGHDVSVGGFGQLPQRPGGVLPNIGTLVGEEALEKRDPFGRLELPQDPRAERPDAFVAVGLGARRQGSA